MKIFTTIKQILLEANPNSKRNKELIDAIKNRHPVSFYYNGPRGEVLAGRRIKSELVAMGLTSKGNLVVRGWVKPPSTSKKGFEKHGWRLFKLSGMSGVKIYDEETFDIERPGLNKDGDRTLTTVYATSDWGVRQPDREDPQPDLPQPEQQPRPDERPPQPDLPQPEPDNPPDVLPDANIRRDLEVFNDLENKAVDVDGEKSIQPSDLRQSITDLYKLKNSDWVSLQQEKGLNTKAGEGTRRRLEKEAEVELYKLLKEKNIKVSEMDTQLQESVFRIKTLMLF